MMTYGAKLKSLNVLNGFDSKSYSNEKLCKCSTIMRRFLSIHVKGQS